MIREQDKELVRAFILDVWGHPEGGERMRDVIAEGFVDHQPWGDVSDGIDEQVRQHGLFHDAFDITIDLRHVFAEDDLVCDHWVGELTHKGEFLGIPSTGRTFTVHAIDVHRVEDGRIAESWHMEDFALRLAELREVAAHQAGTVRAEIVRRWFELLDGGRVAEAVELFTDDAEYVNDQVSLRGRDEILTASEEVLVALPDMRHEILAALPCGEDAVTIEGRFTATFSGPMGDLPPTGRAADVRLAAVVRFNGDRMASWHGYYDRLTLNEQLGIPAA